MVEVPQEMLSVLRTSKQIVGLMHIGADGDSIGSLIAFQRAFTKLGKKVYIPAPDYVPARYQFMQKYANGWGYIEDGIDAIVVIDCSSSARIDWGNFERIDGVPLLNIDHHEGNPDFGDFNWVDPSRAAAGIMVYELLKKLSATIDEKSANALYVALMTDTGRFAFSNADFETFQIAAELVELGASPKYLTSEVYFNFSEDYLRNIGIALFNSRSFHGGRILFLTLDRATMRNFSTSPENSEGIIDFAMAVRDVDVAVLFKELGPNKICVSLRSRRGLDICRVAERFSGGGHPNAAGCTINNNLAYTQKVILNLTRKVLGFL